MNDSEAKNELAWRVCRKPGEISFGECLKTFGQDNQLCRDYGRCRIEEKSEEQLEYIFSSRNENVFLKACPGSGKTEVVGLKAAYEVMKWDAKVGGIAILTFTNNAADVISKRVMQFAGIKKLGYPHFVGTINSWLHGYIANPFSHLLTGYKGKEGDHSLRIVDEDSTSDWLNAFVLDTRYSYYKGKERTLSSMPLYSNNIRFNHEKCLWELKLPGSKINGPVQDDKYFNSTAFAEFRNEKSWLTLEYMRGKFKESKNKFNKAGFATYQDIENICYLLLDKNSNLSRLLAERFPLIIVDECQDLSWIQLQIFRRLIEAGSIVHFVGDLNQAIWSFREVDPRKVSMFVECENFKTCELSNNFRSVQSIVDICGRLVKQGNIQGRAVNGNEPFCIYITYDKNKKNLQEIVAWFVSYLGRESVNLTPKESAVVARGHSTINRLRPAASRVPNGKQLQLATAIHLWKTGEVESICEALDCIGHFVSNNIFSTKAANSKAHYYPDCELSKVRWRLFLAQILDKCVEAESLGNLNQEWSAWAKCVKKQFLEIVESCSKSGLPSLSKHSLKFNALSGKTKLPVISTLETIDWNNVPNILVTTFHKVKGQTFDAVLVVSAPNKQSKGGHWSQWVDARDSDGEHARFAYVASSRPRFLLAWAVPTPKNEEIREIEDLGFTKVT